MQYKKTIALDNIIRYSLYVNSFAFHSMIIWNCKNIWFRFFSPVSKHYSLRQKHYLFDPTDRVLFSVRRGHNIIIYYLITLRCLRVTKRKNTSNQLKRFKRTNMWRILLLHLLFIIIIKTIWHICTLLSAEIHLRLVVCSVIDTKIENTIIVYLTYERNMHVVRERSNVLY